ncbi:Hypothetical protein Asd1617_05081 [Shigella dysenteriae 1617]|uniref:Uncharacterized protein n=1 Tax=Shigella dysenteriae 1617 TaxID=754093 RepID=A0A0A7A113_SHIDY|nr:Hypothetical protein Asd1617_02518 [Shigella dysenteriae 1617]AHA65519.1 Hypothetical protein Asd1617_02692 [Shigella dysenteriae 1617]AHA67759.1 Hypothetical protein Asd1617_04932 [Shigella dysenteriae 1617]AHA67908.1 Hypothetical protein Asd1617_05081 [Shigella dysenteriae 1617]
MLPGFTANETPLLIKFADKTPHQHEQRAKTLFALA